MSYILYLHARVAQLGLEHDTPNVGAAGSNPVSGIFILT